MFPNGLPATRRPSTGFCRPRSASRGGGKTMPKPIVRQTGYGCIMDWRASGLVWDFRLTDSWIAPAVWTPSPRFMRGHRLICFQPSSGRPAGWKSSFRMLREMTTAASIPPAPARIERLVGPPICERWAGSSGAPARGRLARASRTARRTHRGPHVGRGQCLRFPGKGLVRTEVPRSGTSSGANGVRPVVACALRLDGHMIPMTPITRSRRRTEAEA